MSKHKKGYFKGKYVSYLLTAYTSYSKSVEAVTNKQIAKELGLSLSTFQKIKSGKQGKKSKVAIELKHKLSNHLTYNNILSEKGRIIYRAIETIRRNENKKIKKGRKKIKKGIKELSNKQMNNIKKKALTKIEIEVENIFESHYEGEK